MVVPMSRIPLRPAGPSHDAALPDLVGVPFAPSPGWSGGGGGTALDPERAIVRRLLSKAFRKSPADGGVRAHTARVARTVVTERRPLRLLLPVGGYKSPASLEYPHVGWAEVFAIAGLRELVAPICAAHAPGVEVELSSDAPIVDRLTGADRFALARYHADLSTLLTPTGPPNLALRLTTIGDAYDISDLRRRMAALGAELAATWLPALDADERERLLRRARSNRVDPTGRSDERVVSRSVCEHEAFLRIDRRARRDSFWAPDTVPVSQRAGLPGFLHLGGNRRSATQFWVGTGIAIRGRRGLKPHIVPPRRAATLAPRLRHPTTGLALPGLRTVPVLDRPEAP